MTRKIVGCMLCYEIKVMKITIQVSKVTEKRNENELLTLTSKPSIRAQQMEMEMRLRLRLRLRLLCIACFHHIL
jgi:hypothetical protein